MRLWSLHPSLLDPQGLVALWREALLAQKVLAGRTKGYQRHPQLERFKKQAQPLKALGAYLMAVAEEAEVRGYHFDKTKILKPGAWRAMPLQRGQLLYEWKHLNAKLRCRNAHWHDKVKGQQPKPHPSFRLRPGGTEGWERILSK